MLKDYVLIANDDGEMWVFNRIDFTPKDHETLVTIISETLDRKIEERERTLPIATNVRALD
jgi:hypothetical protein